MLMTKQRRPAIRTLRGWAINALNEAGAIRECEEHGWMQDRADPHARERAFDIARRDLPEGVSRQAAEAAVRDVLDSIGDTCPECRPDEKDRRHPRTPARLSDSAAQPFLHTLARVTDLLDCLFHRRCRLCSLLCLVLHFVVLPASHPRPVLFSSARRLALLRYCHEALLL